MKLSTQEIAALYRIENKKAFYGDPLILAKMYRQLEAEIKALRDIAQDMFNHHRSGTCYGECFIGMADSLDALLAGVDDGKP